MSHVSSPTLLYEDDAMLTSLNSLQKDTNMAAIRISDMEPVKPKLSLCSIIKGHATKIYGEWRYSSTIDLGSRWR
jgi:hypothetical protein